MSRKTSRRDVEAPETLESLKVSARVSEAATSRLGLGSEGLVHIPATCTVVFHFFLKAVCLMLASLLLKSDLLSVVLSSMFLSYGHFVWFLDLHNSCDF